MDEQFIRNRITQLRMEHGVTERKMSRDMGHSDSYIHSISSGRNMPSLSELLYICTYLHVTPEEFFRTGEDVPLAKRRVIEKILKLQDEDVSMISGLIDRIEIKEKE